MIVRDDLPKCFRMRVIVLTFISPSSTCEAICQEDKSNAAQMQAVFFDSKDKNCHEQTLTLPTFTIHLRQRKVNIPYIECLAWFTFPKKHPIASLSFLSSFLEQKNTWTNSNLQMNPKGVILEAIPDFSFFFPSEKRHQFHLRDPTK